MRRALLLGGAVLLATLASGAARAQDAGPIILVPPDMNGQTAPAKPKPKPPASPLAPIELFPEEQRTSLMVPPMPHLRPATAAFPVAGSGQDVGEAGQMLAAVPGASDVPSGQPAGDGGATDLAAVMAAAPTSDAAGPGAQRQAMPNPNAVATAEQPGAAALSPGGPDMAYGAFQRGYYLSAFSLAIPRAEAGDTAAQTLLGLIYEGGYGVPRDPAQAASWYEFAATGGNREAQFALGMMYLEGRGVSADGAKAASYFEKASAGGQIAATYNLALLYLEGKVFPADLNKAAALFQSAAEAGNPDAQYVLAQLYEDGRGVAQNQETSTRWFAEAARLGNIPAQVEYAIRLFNGVGTAANETAAAQWFKRAADVGNPVAQNRLARLLATGRGIPADPVAAAKWHVLAMAAGKKDDYLDQFFAGLTAEQRQTAVALAQRWPAD